MPLRKLGEGGAYQCHTWKQLGSSPWLCAWGEAPWAGRSPDLCWGHLTQWGAPGSGSECHPSTRNKSVNNIIIFHWDPTEIFSSPHKCTQKFPESGTEHSSYKTGAASREKHTFNGRKKKKRKVNIHQFYELFVQLSILKDPNLHAFQLVNVCLQDMVLNTVLTLWLFCFFNFYGFTLQNLLVYDDNIKYFDF